MKYERVNGKESFLIGILGIPTYIALIAIFYKYHIFWLFIFLPFLVYDYYSQGNYLANVRTNKYGIGSYILRSIAYQSVFLAIVYLVLNYST